jgi:hypothetical protein
MRVLNVNHNSGGSLLGILAVSLIINTYPRWIFLTDPDPKITIHNQSDHVINTAITIQPKEIDPADPQNKSQFASRIAGDEIKPGESIEMNPVFYYPRKYGNIEKNELMFRIVEKGIDISICDSRFPTIKGEFKIVVSGNYDVRIIDVYDSCYWAN